MLRMIAVGATCVAAMMGPVCAGSASDVLDRVNLTRLVQVMQQEGLEYGADLQSELLQGRGGDEWTGIVGAIYDPVLTEASFRARFDDAMPAEHVDDVLAYFDTPLGAQILALEISAREAFVDEAVEEASRAVWIGLEADKDPWLEKIDTYVDTNNLIESNVEGGLNASLAFMTGMLDGGAFQGEMTTSEMIGEVWSQEPDIRNDVIDWVMAYSTMAYRPLSDADMDSYIAFSQSEAGRAYNRALFTAFDTVYNDISHALGQATAMMLTQQEI